MLKFNNEYDKIIRQYTKQDGFSALFLFVIFIFLYSLVAILDRFFQFDGNQSIIIGNILNLTIILITILFVLIHKQKLDTIGIMKGNWKKSSIIGLIFAFFLFMFNFGIDYFIYGGAVKSIDEILWLMIYYLNVSLCEEIVFRGYIQTRIYGLIKNKIIALVLVSLLFTFMHFPYRMIAYGMSLEILLFGNFFWVVQLLIMHVIWSLIYSKTNSLYGSIISHWVSNLASNIKL